MAAARCLPSGNLIIAYGHCSNAGKVLQAARDGVNVVIWAFITKMEKDEEGNPRIVHNPFDCVGPIASTLQQEGLPTTHLVSIGGWNEAHPDTSFSGEEWFAVWEEWNARVVARPELGFHGFDGFDWDLEGNDNLASPYNFFPVPVLDIMGTMSQAAKRKGYLVGMAPAQSYFDVGTTLFDRSLLHAPEWMPDFPYGGRNAYAYVVAKYSVTPATAAGKVGEAACSHHAVAELADDAVAAVATFDFISVQLYEGWSRANYEIALRTPPLTPAQYLEGLARTMIAGWRLQFSHDPDVGLPDMVLNVKQPQLIIGLANGWTDVGTRFLLLFPQQVAEAWAKMPAHVRPRGVMFWVCGDEGRVVESTGQPLWMARGLNTFLHVRPVPPEGGEAAAAPV